MPDNPNINMDDIRKPSNEDDTFSLDCTSIQNGIAISIEGIVVTNSLENNIPLELQNGQSIPASEHTVRKEQDARC